LKEREMKIYPGRIRGGKTRGREQCKEEQGNYDDN